MCIRDSPTSTDLFKIEELGEGVSELYNSVIENADQIISNEDFLESGVLTGFTAYLEELGETLEGLTPEEADLIDEVIAPLLLDIDQGLYELIEGGRTDNALFGASQVMAEVLGAVYYAAEIADDDPTVGLDILQGIAPQVVLLSETFNDIIETFTETGTFLSLIHI